MCAHNALSAAIARLLADCSAVRKSLRDLPVKSRLQGDLAAAMTA
jgi:hypothetical protein